MANPPNQVPHHVAQAILYGQPFRGNSMKNFTEAPLSFEAARVGGFRTVGALYDVELHTASDKTELARLMPTLIEECENADDHRQKSAFFCSILLLFFPDLEDVVVRELTISGMKPGICDTAAKRVIAGFALKEADPLPVCYVFLTQCVLLLYKNISEQNYKKFMTARTLAIRALVGVSDSVKLETAFSLETAKAIRQILGAKHVLKRELLTLLIDGCYATDTLKIVCNYVTGILSWTDMAYMTFIVETLLRPNSPVLRDPRIQQEVVNLAAAFKKINQHTYPQYYRIMADPTESRCMERSKFPTLIGLAKALKSAQQTTVRQFISPAESTNPLIGQLLTEHNRYMLANGMIEPTNQ